MSAKDNSGDNSGLTNLANDVNNDNIVIAFKDNNSIKSSTNNNKSRPLSRNQIEQNIAPDSQQNCPANKSSNRNAINFLVLGYFILVLVIFYGYFGSLITGLITNSEKTKVNENKTKTEISNQNSTDFDNKDLKTNETIFYRNITSTELIVILWITIIYGSSLLLYMRFRVLTLERDPNSEKNKKKDSTEELNAFMANNRKNRQSFKDKILKTDNKVKDDSNQPFWKK